MFPILFHYINPEFFHHEVCQLSKHARNSYLIQGYKSISTFCIGSQWHMGTLQSRYYLGSLVVYFICWLPHSNHLGVLKKKKSEASTILEVSTKWSKQTKIKMFWSDTAKDYFNSILGEYLMDKGIVHQSLYVDTPQ